ncbi:SAV_2336 N-terminal domain-related protein [Streptomyces sp. 7N604]|uniref:SAV_2336 N-terminal domain-related protein n=1 Tax=Streptomyces sp. 7N604 TaxID=3457415 RepID=UPI003FD498F1
MSQKTLTALVARLREAGIEPTAEELADALWLATLASPDRGAAGGRPESAAAADPAAQPASEDTASGANEPPAAAQPEPVDARRPGSRRRAELFARPPHRDRGGGDSGDGSEGGTLPVRVPVAAALPDPGSLQRALRPLKHFRAPAPPLRTALDEQTTADRAADTGLVVPVLRGVRRREARVQLLMDVSTSMAVWEQTLDELRQVCERAGAFREVRVHYVHEDEGGAPGIGATTAPGSVLHAPAQFADPTGRLLTLLLSDCAGPMWRSGRMQRLLHRWTATAPVAVVQPLPQRMWRRTHLPAVPGVLRRREGPAGRLEFTPSRGGDGQGGTPVPVLAPAQAALGTWARLVSGTAGLSLNAAAGWVRADHAGSTAARRSSDPREAPARVQAFRRSASPEAAQLAVHLSAVPLVLPVMQLVQRAMLAGSGPSVLAEVLLSGLLRRTTPEGGEGDGGEDGGGELWYEFLDGVREELLRQLPMGDAQLVLKHCSQYVERHFGRRARNFPAMAAAYLAGSVERPTAGQGEADAPGLRRFARVSEQVLRRFLPSGAVPVAPEFVVGGPVALVEQARQFLVRFERDGTARDLDEAVRLLQVAVEVEPREETGAAVHSLLADALLLRWEARRVSEDLRAAWAAADRAAERDRSALLTLGRILTEMAGEEQDEQLAFQMLLQADQSLAHMPDVARTSIEHGLRYGLLRVDVLRKAAEAGRDIGVTPAHAPWDIEPGEDWYVTTMGRAVRASDALLEWGPVADALAAVLIIKGRLLLDVARHYAGTGSVSGTADPARPGHVREYAASARTRIEEGLAELAEEPWPDDELARVWLDLAEARELAAGGLMDDAVYGSVKEALSRARQLAEQNRELRIECLWKSAEAGWSRHQQTGGIGELALAEMWLDAAANLAGRNHPLHAQLLTFRGQALSKSAPLRASAADAEQAVRCLREALAETPDGHPELARRRLLFGDALRLRFEYGRSLVDLHEADWILGAAARESEEPEIVARASLLRGDVAVALARITGSRERRQRGADDYRRAAVFAERQGNPVLAAQARLRRGSVLETTAGPAHALEEYRKAVALLEDAGGLDQADPIAAVFIAARIEALEAGDA